MFEYDLFISYSTRYTTEAQTIEKQARQKGLKVFLANLSLKPGDAWEDEIRQALFDSRELCVLATPESLKSEWVVSEWSAAWLLKKRITAILLGCERQDLPARLLEYQTADYYKVDLFLDKVVERKQEDPLGEIDLITYYQFRSHKLVQTTLFAPIIRQSPFVFEELIKVTQRKILIAGQNLYTLIVAYGMKNKEILFNFLRKNNKREVQIMICDPDFKNGVEAWKEVTASKEYERDLRESISILEEWVKEAEENKLHFEAKKTPMVPVSITFVDPEERDGKLFLTPNVFQATPGVRACYLLCRKLHKDTFTTYWENYKLTYLRARLIGRLE